MFSILNIIVLSDRRTTSVIGAILCYFTRKVFFNDEIDLLEAVNFDVMVLLSSIMIINHLVMHVQETKDLIQYMQSLVQTDPIRGLWMLSFAAFLVSPFLTNDGVCLLFVEPILKAFQHAPYELSESQLQDNIKKMVLRKADAIYFLLALACSANIGSALTYTGNPQNMIISSDALPVLPPYKFLLYMLPASLFSWVTSK
jgi:Na+/H+ antiporter NhaD/arsenite permease-like protein